MNSKKHSLSKRIGYWFDNTMAQGFGPKVRLLLIVTIVFVALIALLAAIAHGGVREHFLSDFIRSFMYSLGKGGALNTDDAGISVSYFILMLLTIIYCMFFSAILIGLISNALRSKVEDLGRGQSSVLEDEHTLILGFNDATFVILHELIEANKNLAKPQTVVILGDVEQKNMIEQIQKRVGWPKRTSKTRIVCRTGSIYDFDDLRRCSIETSHSVIINASNDFEAIKAIMACSHILNDAFDEIEKAPFLISIIQSDENLTEARLAAAPSVRERLTVLALNEVVARIMVHTSRQPGLSDVFTELFNFTDSELYIISEDPSCKKLYGKTISEINQELRAGYAVGIKRDDGCIVIESPLTTVFEEGDSLIVVDEDDNLLQLSEIHESKVAIPSIKAEPTEKTNVLICGVEPVLDAVLMEYSNYLPEGSSIHVVDNNGRADSIVTDETREKLSNKDITLSVSDTDINRKRQINKLLDAFSPDCVLILADEEAINPDAEDERVMRILIYLREYRSRSEKQFSITCEMLQSKNKELASATEPDDFIISRQFSALMMAQISYNEDMSTLFEALLSSKGFEIYMKPAHWYLPMGEALDLFSVSELVAVRGEVFMGIRQKVDGYYHLADINPVKYNTNSTLKEYIFTKDDYLVVLARNNGFPVGA